MITLKLYRGRVYPELNNSKLKELNSLKRLSKYNQALLYVYLTEDFSDENPLSTVRYNEREAEAEQILFDGKKLSEVFTEEEVAMIQKAREVYAEKALTDYQKDMKVYNQKLDQFADALAGESPEIIRNVKKSTGEVMFSSNIKWITRLLNDAVDVVAIKTRLAEMYINRSDTDFEGRDVDEEKEKEKEEALQKRIENVRKMRASLEKSKVDKALKEKRANTKRGKHISPLESGKLDGVLKNNEKSE